jgi:hypothetical protein
VGFRSLVEDKSLLIFGAYDTKVCGYALTRGTEAFDFGRKLPVPHRIVRLGFSLVPAFYYLVGAVLIILG